MSAERFDPFTIFNSLTEYEAYEMSLKRQRDSYSIVTSAREEGKEETLIWLVQRMKTLGKSMDEIVLITGLSEEQISEM